MARKNSVSKKILFTALLLAALLTLVLRQKYTKGLNFLFIKVFNPILNIPSDIDTGFVQADISSKDTPDRAAYDKLRTDYDNLLALLREEHERYETLSRIRSQLPGNDSAGIVIAKIRRVLAKGLHYQFVINKGQSDNLKAGQYVLGQNCIIGTVSQTSPDWSIIDLLTDSKHSIEIGIYNKENKKYILGRMTGTGKGSGRIGLVPTEYEIRPNAPVYAMARNGFLEDPVVIGEISKIETSEKDPLLWDIEVKPIIDIGKLTEVAVIVIEP